MSETDKALAEARKEVDEFLAEQRSKREDITQPFRVLGALVSVGASAPLASDFVPSTGSREE